MPGPDNPAQMNTRKSESAIVARSRIAKKAQPLQRLNLRHGECAHAPATDTGCLEPLRCQPLRVPAPRATLARGLAVYPPARGTSCGSPSGDRGRAGGQEDWLSAAAEAA